jgi:hypothetical protein
MKVEEFASSLFALETDIHIAHLQTDSFAVHMALNSLYQDIVDLRDRFIESYQGKYGIIKGYKSFSISEGLVPVKYLTTKSEEYTAFRETLDCSYCQQICDDILELINGTLYKLKFLKY